MASPNASTGAPDSANGQRATSGKKRRWLIRGLIIALAVVVVGGSATGVYIYRTVQNTTEKVHRSSDLNPSGNEETGRHHSSVKGPQNVLLLGSDSRKTGDVADGRSDTLMLLHLSADREAAYVISFPRDLYVDIPGHGKDKINSAFAEGGPKLTAKTLQQLTGAETDHTAIVNFTGFIKLTDDLGGVTVKNDYAFSAHGHHYDKGKVTLSGEKALWFVRERHNLPHGDLDRARNQRKVVQAILDKGLSGNTIAKPGKFSSFTSGIAENVTVDDQLGDQDLRKLALSLRMGPGDVKQIQAPISGFRTVRGVGEVDVVDKSDMKQLSSALKNDDLDTYLKQHPQRD